MGFERALVFASAPAAKHVLQTNQRSYRRPDAWMETLQGVTGKNLFNTDGDGWLSRRRTLQPAFQRDRLDALAETITTVADAELDGWPRGVAVDLTPRALELTMSVVGRTLFGESFRESRDALHVAFKTLLDEVFYRLVMPIRLPERVPTPRNLRVRRARARVFGFLDGLVAAHRARPHQDDLLGMLAEASDPETGEKLSDVELRNEAALMVHAGHETTASTLSSAIWLLGKHRECQARVRDEVRREIGDDVLTVDALARCEALDCGIRETMRLFPPAWASADRVAVEDDVIEGFDVRAGERVWIALRELHRNEAHWPDPHRFDPDRFLPERSEGRDKHAFIPFAAGRRRCIGEHLAMLELRVVLARLITRFDIETLDPGDEPPLHVTFTLAPKSCSVRLTERATKARAA